MGANGPKLLEVGRKVHLGAGGQLPSISAHASHEEQVEETRREGVDAKEAVDSVDWVYRKGNDDEEPPSSLAAVAAGTHGSQIQNSATTWASALRWELCARAETIAGWQMKHRWSRC